MRLIGKNFLFSNSILLHWSSSGVNPMWTGLDPINYGVLQTVLILLGFFLCQGIDMETGDTVSCFVIDVDMNNWLFVAKPLPEAHDNASSETGKVYSVNIYIILNLIIFSLVDVLVANWMHMLKACRKSSSHIYEKMFCNFWTLRTVYHIRIWCRWDRPLYSEMHHVNVGVCKTCPYTWMIEQRSSLRVGFRNYFPSKYCSLFVKSLPILFSSRNVSSWALQKIFTGIICSFPNL